MIQDQRLVPSSKAYIWALRRSFMEIVLTGSKRSGQSYSEGAIWNWFHWQRKSHPRGSSWFRNLMQRISEAEDSRWCWPTSIWSNNGGNLRAENSLSQTSLCFRICCAELVVVNPTYTIPGLGCQFTFSSWPLSWTWVITPPVRWPGAGSPARSISLLWTLTHSQWTLL